MCCPALSQPPNWLRSHNRSRKIRTTEYEIRLCANWLCFAASPPRYERRDTRYGLCQLALFCTGSQATLSPGTLWPPHRARDIRPAGRPRFSTLPKFGFVLQNTGRLVWNLYMEVFTDGRNQRPVGRLDHSGSDFVSVSALGTSGILRLSQVHIQLY